MWLHETLAEFSDIVRRYEVIQYEVEGPHSRLKIRVLLVDDSQLHVRETVLDGQRRKYAYHWQDPAAVLGEGAMGMVYRAEQLDAEGQPLREVALKMVQPSFSCDPDFARRFLREVRITEGTPARVRQSAVLCLLL